MTNILVTGSSRGIGCAIASGLAARGARVIGHRSAGGDSTTIAADLLDPLSPQLLWQQAREALDGQIDVLVNNAGLFSPNPISASDIGWIAEWEDCLRISLSAAAQLSRFAVRHWQQTGRPGRIVHISSRAAHRGDSPDHWHYAAAKAGMLAMHKTIARAYATEGILSFAIAPGFVDTSPKESGADDYLASRGGPALLADIPLGRVGEPEEIAAVAVFCALDAPASMTGAVIDANGASYVR